ncbi:sugar ABC transporter substrate-binding protein [Solirubrobacter deserti]|uniref:Sugar ABC transporter substrate-binding protein n=1 Tax=Solirubrobacter deserti TaxID=2282478 RepID=A0ABT4RV72_9ACTN|nr:sugar ABC transporter substrate-binding protein [Solirubrobacter deserti]MDA0142273.1 sugar ABC transporter substrate-binding protein [Solirubrobacter deserti]
MRRWLILLALLVVAGCGKETTEPAREIVVRTDDSAPRDTPDQQSRGVRIASSRIVFVTHGQASDEFWTVVRRGLQDAGRQTGAAVSYRAPDSFSIDRMRQLIDQAVADHPDGLVVSVPDAEAVGPSIERAVAEGIPTITINSGSDAFKRLGVLAHVGQPEYKAGVEAGRRLAQAGVRRALCVNQESGNAGLDERCRGLQAGLRRSGGTVSPLSVPLQDAATAQRRMSEAITEGDVDGVVTLGPGAAKPAIDAVSASGPRSRITLATFDLSPEVLEAVRDGEMLFAVDQQPYLQGFLPVILLAEQARHQVFPGKGSLIPTGPQFVTETNAEDVLRLSAEGVR